MRKTVTMRKGFSKQRKQQSVRRREGEQQRHLARVPSSLLPATQLVHHSHCSRVAQCHSFMLKPCDLGQRVCVSPVESWLTSGVSALSSGILLKECVHKKAESDPNVVDSNTDTCCEDIGKDINSTAGTDSIDVVDMDEPTCVQRSAFFFRWVCCHTELLQNK